MAQRAEQDNTTDELLPRAGLRLVLRNVRTAFKRRVRIAKHWQAVIGGLLVALLFIYRALLQPYALAMRCNFLAWFSVIVILLVVAWQVGKGEWVRRISVAFIGAVLIVFGAFFGTSIHEYIALYFRYNSAPIEELDELPVSGYERVQPLNSVYSLAHEAISESETPTRPHFVRVGNDFQWVLAVEPAYLISRLIDGVRELYSVSATRPAPNFALQKRIAVQFPTGEDLALSRNSHAAVIKRFGLWRFFSYEPAEILYLKDDTGEWVQVISLIHWKGIFFPRPEFGGVQVIRQQQEGFSSWLSLLLFGVGEWIPPADIDKYRYLKGQNILASRVSRAIANSFRFQSGFFAPFPGYHKGDIRIPDLAEDVNDQPFVVYLEQPGQKEGALYHYIALEPYDPLKQGLNTSLFIPADGGRNRVFVYKHHRMGGSLAGVSTVAAKVMESRKNYDWSRNRPVEHRPFIRKIAGKTRFFWLTTIVTYKDVEQEGAFIAGSAPEVVITDAAYNTSVWVDAKRPESWTEELEKELAAEWGS